MTAAHAPRTTDPRIRVGLDVGGTKIDAVAVAAGEIIGRIRRPTGWGEDAVVAGVVGAVEALGREAGFRPDEVGSVGVGIPGMVDADSGLVLHAVNLGVDSLDLAARAEQALGIPFRIENDVKAAALGAAALRGADGTMAYLNLGTGVAAGIVVDGRIWRGARGTAGEVGHLSVDPAGRLCAAGSAAASRRSAAAAPWPGPGAAQDRRPSATSSTRRTRGTPRPSRCATASSSARLRPCACWCSPPTSSWWSSAAGSPVWGSASATASGPACVRTPSRRRSCGRSAWMEESNCSPPASPAAAFGAALVGASIPEKEIVAHG